MVMSELPPMPKPSEFGITEEDWRHDLCCHEARRSYSRNPFGKVEAYFNALDAWTCSRATAQLWRITWGHRIVRAILLPCRSRAATGSDPELFQFLDPREERIGFPSGVTATPWTGREWPSSVRNARPVSRFHTFSVLSPAWQASACPTPYQIEVACRTPPCRHDPVRIGKIGGELTE
jgi:hypothetical protein